MNSEIEDMVLIGKDNHFQQHFHRFLLNSINHTKEPMLFIAKIKSKKKYRIN